MSGADELRDAADDAISRLSDEDLAVVAWFSGLSTVNQFAAGLNPRGWAEAQAKNVDVSVDELERRANVWQAYMQALAKEDE